MKDELKKEYKEVEYAHIQKVDFEGWELQGKIDDLDNKLLNKKELLIQSYEEKMQRLEAELELRLKVEIHEIEERKN